MRLEGWGRAVLVGWIAVAAAAVACSSFSDPGVVSEDAGTGNDASTDASSLEGATSNDAAHVTLYSEDFEDSAETTCGVGWDHMNGVDTRMVGDAHGGTRFCRFCAKAIEGVLGRRFDFTGHDGYVLSAWVRLSVHPDDAGPDATVSTKATAQLFAYGSNGGQVGTDTQEESFAMEEWRFVQANVPDVAASTHEQAYFFPGVFAANNEYCIDVDDVTLVAP